MAGNRDWNQATVIGSDHSRPVGTTVAGNIGPVFVGKVSRSTIVIDIPASLNSSMRKFSRVEPSLRSPVMLHIYTPQEGTASFTVQDITEQGLSFVAGSLLALENSFMCGLQIPVDRGTFIFSNAAVVYKIESLETDKKTKKMNAFNNILYGLALFPHSEDVKKIRSYMNNRDLEIKKKIQKGVSTRRSLGLVLNYDHTKNNLQCSDEIDWKICIKTIVLLLTLNIV